jgi:4-hydroxy-2-oxoheptanedioate aldolase
LKRLKPSIASVDLGPNDMAFALDGHVGHPRPKSEAALAHVLAAATRHGIPVGIFCSSGEEARTRVEQGFRLVTPGNDFAHLTRSMRDAVRVTLQDTSPETATQNGY